MKSLVLVVLATLWAGTGLAQVPISGLPVATTSTDGTEVLPVVQSAQTRKMSLEQILAFLEGQNNVWTGSNQFQAISASSATIASSLTSNGLLDSFTIPTQAIHGGSIEGPSLFLEYLGYNIGWNGTNWITGTDGGSNGAALESSSHGTGDWCLRTIVSTGGSNQTIPDSSLPACAIFVDRNQVITTPGATSVPWPTWPVPRFAYGSINGISGCVVDTQVSNFGISSCTHLSTGDYEVIFSGAVGFTAPPACTVAVGSGSSGGSNADSIQSGTTSLSGSNYVLDILAFSAAIAAQDNHFMITCMGH